MISYKNLKRYVLIFNFSFLFMANFLFSSEGYEPISVYLTWKKSPETTMSIQWISNKPEVEDLVFYQVYSESTDALNCRPFLQKSATHINMPQGHPFLIHHVELTNLEPGSAYAFKISENGKLFKFKTISTDLSTIKFVEGGDVYHDTIEIVAETNKQAAKLSPDFAVIGGDIAYSADSHDFFPEDMRRWLNFLITWKKTMVTPEGFLIPIIPAIGNHETSGRYGKTPSAAPFFYALFPMPGMRGYNVLDFGKYMSIILLDSGHTHPIGGSQTDWLSNTLKNRQEVPYKFAVYHVPAYPSVRNYSYQISEFIRKYWVPEFDTYSLKAAFEHHDHAYKRTHPLKAGKTHENGVVYLGDGGWGVAKARQPKRTYPYIAKGIATGHFILVTITKDEVKYEAINQKGEIIDQYTQKK